MKPAVATQPAGSLTTAGTIPEGARTTAPSMDPSYYNTLGRMTCLTMLTPIRPQFVHLIRVVFALGRRIEWMRRLAGILQFNFIQFVRWAVVQEFPYNGPPQQREKLNYAYLYFESNFDGPWQHYIDAFAYVIPHNIRRLWGRGIAFPGPPPAEPLKAWIGMNSHDGGTYYMAYPHASTRMVQSGVVVREKLRALVAESRDLDAEAFLARYQQFLTEVQSHI